MHEKFAKYVLIDRRYDLFNLRKKLKHRVEYELIVDYKFI